MSVSVHNIAKCNILILTEIFWRPDKSLAASFRAFRVSLITSKDVKIIASCKRMLVLTEVLNIFFNDFDAKKSVRCYQEFSPNSEMGPSVFLEAIFKKSHNETG